MFMDSWWLFGATHPCVTLVSGTAHLLAVIDHSAFRGLGTVLRDLAVTACCAGLTWYPLALLFYGFSFVRYLPGTSGMDHVEQTGLCLILVTVAVCLVTTVALGYWPLGTSPEALSATVRWIHRFGVSLLGVFLLLALYFQAALRLRINRGDIRNIRRIYQQWRWVTEVAAAPAAIMLFFTGFNRIFSVPGYSVGHWWLFVLVAMLGLMMSDGIFGYTPSLRRLSLQAQACDTAEDFHLTSRGVWRDVTFFIHSVSFPLVIVFPIWRVGEGYSPATPFFQLLGLDPFDSGWSQLTAGIALFLVFFCPRALFAAFRGRRTGRGRPIAR